MNTAEAYLRGPQWQNLRDRIAQQVAKNPGLFPANRHPAPVMTPVTEPIQKKGLTRRRTLAEIDADIAAMLEES